MAQGEELFGVAKPRFDGPSGFVEASTFAEGEGLAEAGGDVVCLPVAVSDGEDAKCQRATGIIGHFHGDDAIGLLTGLKLFNYFPALWYGDDEVFPSIDQVGEIMIR